MQIKGTNVGFFGLFLRVCVCLKIMSVTLIVEYQAYAISYSPSYFPHKSMYLKCIFVIIPELFTGILCLYCKTLQLGLHIFQNSDIVFLIKSKHSNIQSFTILPPKNIIMLVYLRYTFDKLLMYFAKQSTLSHHS